MIAVLGDGSVFDVDEAYARLSASLEDGTGRVEVRLFKTNEPNTWDEWSIVLQVGKSRGCAGAVRIAKSPDYSTGTGRWLLSVRNGTSYRLRLADPDVRRMISAVWSELDRQGIREAI